MPRSSSTWLSRHGSSSTATIPVPTASGPLKNGKRDEDGGWPCWKNEQPNWRQPGQRSPSSIGMTTRTRLSSAQLRRSSGARKFLRVLSSTSRAGLSSWSRPLLLHPSPPRCRCQRRNQHAVGHAPDGCQKPRICGAFFLALMPGPGPGPGARPEVYVFNPSGLLGAGDVVLVLLLARLSPFLD